MEEMTLQGKLAGSGAAAIAFLFGCHELFVLWVNGHYRYTVSWLALVSWFNWPMWLAPASVLLAAGVVAGHCFMPSDAEQSVNLRSWLLIQVLIGTGVYLGYTFWPQQIG